MRDEVCPRFFMRRTGERLAHEFTVADFVTVDTDRLSTVLEYASADDAIGTAFGGGPVAMAYSRFDVQPRRARSDVPSDALPAGDLAEMTKPAPHWALLAPICSRLNSRRGTHASSRLR